MDGIGIGMDGSPGGRGYRAPYGANKGHSKLLKIDTFCNTVVISASMTVAFLIMWPGTIMFNEVMIDVQLS